jgi:hypothetical protein
MVRIAVCHLIFIPTPENILEGWKKHFETLATPAENDTKKYTNTEFDLDLIYEITRKTRYDYNLTIMKSPKPATDNRFK